MRTGAKAPRWTRAAFCSAGPTQRGRSLRSAPWDAKHPSAAGRPQPDVGQDIEATLCWMSEKASLKAGNKYAIKHTTNVARALVKDPIALFSTTWLASRFEARPVILVTSAVCPSMVTTSRQ